MASSLRSWDAMWQERGDAEHQPWITMLSEWEGGRGAPTARHHEPFHYRHCVEAPATET